MSPRREPGLAAGRDEAALDLRARARRASRRPRQRGSLADVVGGAAQLERFPLALRAKRGVEVEAGALEVVAGRPPASASSGDSCGAGSAACCGPASSAGARRRCPPSRCASFCTAKNVAPSSDDSDEGEEEGAGDGHCHGISAGPPTRFRPASGRLDIAAALRMASSGAGLAGPALEAARPLAHEHLQPVDHARAAPRPAARERRSARRRRRDRPRPRRPRAAAPSSVSPRRQADGGRVHEQVDARRERSAVAHAELVRERARALGRAVPDRHLGARPRAAPRPPPGPPRRRRAPAPAGPDRRRARRADRRRPCCRRRCARRPRT